jgi:hypothetical protein
VISEIKKTEKEMDDMLLDDDDKVDIIVKEEKTKFNAKKSLFDTNSFLEDAFPTMRLNSNFSKSQFSFGIK